MRIVATMCLCLVGGPAIAQHPRLPNIPTVVIEHPEDRLLNPNCPRSRPWARDVAGVLTAVSANAFCMPPPTPCGRTWNWRQSRQFPDIRTLYYSIVVTPSDQDGIILQARNMAVPAPAGLYFYRLTFTAHTSGPLTKISVTAHYGVCRRAE